MNGYRWFVMRNERTDQPKHATYYIAATNAVVTWEDIRYLDDRLRRTITTQHPSCGLWFVSGLSKHMELSVSVSGVNAPSDGLWAPGTDSCARSKRAASSVSGVKDLS